MPLRVREGVVDVEVSHNQEGEPKIGEKNIWWDGVNPVVNSVGGVGIDNPEGVEGGAKKRLIGRDVEGEHIVHPLKLGEHCVVGKQRHMKVGSHSWLANRGKERFKTMEGGKVSLVYRRILQKDYQRV